MNEHAGRRVLGHLLSEIQHGHALRQILHHRQMVLDDEEGHAARRDGAHGSHHLVRFARIHAGGRFVEQQQPRAARHGARNLDQPLLAVGELARLALREFAQPERSEEVQRSLALRALPGGPPAVKARETGAGDRMLADQHVLEHRELVEEADVLESALDAQARALVRRPALDALAVVDDLARGGGHRAADEIEEGGLAGAVRADDRVHAFFRDRQIDAVDGGEAAVALRQPLELEDHRESRARSARSRRRSITPCGRKIISRTKSSPYMKRYQSFRKRKRSGRSESTMAPSTAPQNVSMPPKMTNRMIATDICRPKVGGSMKKKWCAYSPPPMPVSAAPTPKASTLFRRTSIPIADAASSSWRMASHARPQRERACSQEKTIASITNPSTSGAVVPCMPRRPPTPPA